MNQVFFTDSRNMQEIPDNSISLIVTSPPYFNIKDYAKDGYQTRIISEKIEGQIGDISDYQTYLQEMSLVWKECERVLEPNGKLALNSPLMPMLKRDFNTHYTRHIFNINSDIEHTILTQTGLFLLDVYIWNRTNPSKKLMFGSYPYPRNFYAQNTIEFITIYVKDGRPKQVPKFLKEKSKLTQSQWLEYTKQIWNIPIPGKEDEAFGVHSAIMPEEIVKRCVKMYTFVGDTVLDPFAGSGTTLKVASDLGRNFVGYEISSSYMEIIQKKVPPRLF